mgnify:CR=1 FL=1
MLFLLFLFHQAVLVVVDFLLLVEGRGEILLPVPGLCLDGRDALGCKNWRWRQLSGLSFAFTEHLVVAQLILQHGFLPTQLLCCECLRSFLCVWITAPSVQTLNILPISIKYPGSFPGKLYSVCWQPSCHTCLIIIILLSFGILNGFTLVFISWIWQHMGQFSLNELADVLLLLMIWHFRVVSLLCYAACAGLKTGSSDWKLFLNIWERRVLGIGGLGWDWAGGRLALDTMPLDCVLGMIPAFEYCLDLVQWLMDKLLISSFVAIKVAGEEVAPLPLELVLTKGVDLWYRVVYLSRPSRCISMYCPYCWRKARILSLGGHGRLLHDLLSAFLSNRSKFRGTHIETSWHLLLNFIEFVAALNVLDLTG